MRDLYQVLREKELEIVSVRKDIDLLRAVIPLLSDEDDLLSEQPLYTPMRAVNSD
jgi:hypothetical protein